MKNPFPRWVRVVALGAGWMDTLTGTGLVIFPAATLRAMQVMPPAQEALEFVRFVGVFVGAVGLCYLAGLQGGDRSRLRLVLSLTRIFRLGAGLFTGAMVLAGWPPSWLAITVTDLGLVVLQTVILHFYADE